MPIKEFEERALVRLRERGFRITMPRVQVVRALGEATKPLNTYEIHRNILAGRGKIDVVSVYRIMATLVECDLAVPAGVPGSERYVRKDFDGPAIVLHHQDDTAETMPCPDTVLTAIAQAIGHGFVTNATVIVGVP